jgi:DNA-binding protein Fis
MEINTQREDEIIVSVKIPMNLADVLEKIQTAILEKVMEKCNGNRTHAANNLGLNRTTLISKAKRHGVIAESNCDEG